LSPSATLAPIIAAITHTRVIELPVLIAYTSTVDQCLVRCTGLALIHSESVATGTGTIAGIAVEGGCVEKVLGSAGTGLVGVESEAVSATGTLGGC